MRIPIPPVSPLLTPAQAARILHTTVRALAAHRRAGTGPRFHRIGYGLIRYTRADITTPTPDRRT